MTAPTPERRVGEAVELHLSGVRYAQTVHGDWLNAVYPELPVHPTTREALDKIARLTAEVARLRKFAEKMITPCEWGPSAFIEEDESDISDWALSHGLLVERVHAQPCEVEGCECDGSPTLLYFAWSPEAAALSLPTPAPEAQR